MMPRRTLRATILVVVAGSAASISASSLAGATGSSTPQHYVCSGAQSTLFDNTNGGFVGNGGTPPTFSTGGHAYCLTYIQTYHWNGGAGAAPGQLGVTVVGQPQSVGFLTGQLARRPRFAALGSTGSGNVPNANWYADVPDATNPTVLDGTYTCYDSSPSSWSTDQQSAGQGFCIIYVVPAVSESGAPAAGGTTTTTSTVAPQTSSTSSSSDDWLWVLLGVLALLAFGAWMWRRRADAAPPASPDPGLSDDDYKHISFPAERPDGPGVVDLMVDPDPEFPHPFPPPTVMMGDDSFVVDEVIPIAGDSAPPDDDVL